MSQTRRLSLPRKKALLSQMAALEAAAPKAIGLNQIGAVESTTPKVIGFTTAGGRSVDVKEVSLLRTKNIFDNTTTDPIQEPFTNISFTSGTNATTKSARNASGLNQIGLVSTATPKVIGFTTAGRRSVDVKEASLLRTKNIFDDIITDPTQEPFTNISFESGTNATPKSVPNAIGLNQIGAVESTTPKVIGFTTPGGRSVDVKEASLLRTKNIFDDIITDPTQEPFTNISFASGTNATPKSTPNAIGLNQIGAVESTTPKVIGFTTAGGRSVDVKEASLLRTKNIFDDIITDPTQEPFTNISFTSGTNATPKSVPNAIGLNQVGVVESATPKVIGFTTAGGRSVGVKEASLLRTKNIFDDIMTDPTQEPFTNISFTSGTNATPKSVPNAIGLNQIGVVETTKPKVIGFTTAGGRSVDVKEASLFRTKNIFEDIMTDPTLKPFSNISFTSASKPTPKSVGFMAPRSISSVRAQGSPLYGSDRSSQKNLEQNDMNHLQVTKVSPRKTLDISGDFPDDDVDFEDCIIESPCAKSTPIVTASGIRLRGKKLFDELTDDEDDEDVAQGQFLRPLQPLGKKCKISNNSSTMLMNVNHTNVDSAGAMTQEVIASTLACLADEAESVSNSPEDFEMNDDLTAEVIRQLDSYHQEPGIADDEDDGLVLKLHPGVLDAREEARARQEMKIRTCASDLVIPKPGFLLKRRLPINTAHQRIRFVDLTKNSSPQFYSKQELQYFQIKRSVSKITSGNAADFRFNVAEFYCDYMALRNEGIHLEDNMYIILSPNSSIGAPEFSSALMSSPGIDPRLISEKWVQNHYRWIVWTLANYETKFPKLFATRALTPENVAMRLKYRYDREIDKSERSAIHRITEQDDVPGKRMILMVAGIKVNDRNEVKHKGTLNQANMESTSSPRSLAAIAAKTSHSHITLELSDGWYSISSITDEKIASFVEDGRIQIGTKLILQNAELVGNEASHPLEADGKLMLKFGANCARRAHWSARLGYCKDSSAFPLKLHSIISTAGIVPLIHCIIIRKYPVIYMTIHEGKRSFESKKAYDRKQRTRELERQSRMEKLQSEVEEEVRLSQSKTNNRVKRSSLQLSFNREVLNNMGPEDLLDLIESSCDSFSIEALLSASKLNQLHEYRYQRLEKYRATVEAKIQDRIKESGSPQAPEPVPILRLCIIDAVNVPVPAEKSYAILSIWRPNDDLLEMLEEGAAFKVSSLMPSSTSPTEIRLNCTRSSKYLPFNISDMSRYQAQRRRHYSFFEILKEGFAPPFGEFDTVGLVVYITPFVPKTGQTVYLADADKNIIGVKFWSPITDQGLEDIMKPESFVVLTNLEWRMSSATCKIPTAFVQDHSLFTPNPKDPGMTKVLAELREDLVDVKRFTISCEMKVYSLLSGRSSLGSH